MRTMRPRARAVMVSLFIAALYASTAPSTAFALPPHARAGGWGAARSAASALPGGPPRYDSNMTVPRGDLRGAIIDNARQHWAPTGRPAVPDRRRRN